MGDINTNIRIDELETQLNKKASADDFGMVKIGTGISVNDGVISVTGGGGGGGSLAVVTPDFSMWSDTEDPDYPPTLSAADLTALNAALTAHESVTVIIPDTDDTYTSYDYITQVKYETDTDWAGLSFKYDGNEEDETYYIDLETGIITKVTH